MSTQYGKLISLILNEHFGEIVQQVGIHMFKYGTSPLALIVKYTKLEVSKVKLALCLLIKHGLVTFQPTRNEYAEYTLQTDRVLLILRYSKFVRLINKLFGEEAEMIIEEMLIWSHAVASDLILKVAKRLKETKNRDVPLADLKEKFTQLVTAKYLIKYATPGEEVADVPVIDIPEVEQHIPPTINLAQLMKGEKSDADIYWRVNFDRFNQEIRDRLLVQAVSQRFDNNAGEIMSILLKQMYTRTEPWAEISNAISLTEIRDVGRKLLQNQLEAISYLDHYLTVIAEDESKFIEKCGDAGGGNYVINLKGAITQLTWSILEAVVLERYDTKAARIFRLVRAKRYIEPEQIQQLAMIPDKEAKRLSYQLLESNFLQLQELRKTNPMGSGPSRLFTLFHIDLDQVVRMVLELCYKCLYNAITRRHHERKVNKRIIDKKHRVDTISMSLKVQGASEDQLADIEEMITPPEKEMLEHIEKVIKKLNFAELEIDDTIFILQLYLLYN